ncbi:MULTISPECIES: enoyl-CoA hydratase [unclassified Sphingopyxis]|uniref:enoyl-CoA hydratase n=1 Tax=unclassified Sphingopyxis TaxID=2614943 RepID=UPI0007311457|nr:MULTISPECIES: enoyl-CoA hydratase [unclassified Sphingopyxis]KTE26382.1 enoyl-CoA hydratase [Sphingopyxis sp. H057]KTE52786.1 enoyl-CoA hydratase [Sphingopyxis sp. H073]KTE54976.1 enoyl-CoA hydratase [Sphingopyxis sp. H071]KTE62437.1 enoyl-CoA hydratase [Sphingopyxis sp. H107]KTE65982.1 enoyl-CoA hydratase [Sphingopyxis sp. H100]
MTYDLVKYGQTGAVAVIEQNRPDKRNAQNQLMLTEIEAALDRAATDASVRVIVIGGIGGHFSAGHDLREGEEKRANLSVEERWAYEEKHFYGLCLKIWDCPKPTIARVQGACVSGAFMMANMCDLIVASDDAYFADPVVHSLGAASVEILVHPWVMGLRRAKEMLFTGERMTAAEANAIGLVNRIAPVAELDNAAMALALRIAEAPPFGVRLTKRSLNHGHDLAGFRSALEAHFTAHELSHFSREYLATVTRGLGAAVDQGKRLLAG